MSNTTSTVNATETTTPSSKHKVILGAFGDGRYSPAMKELYQDSQRLLGFTPIQAHVTAVRLGVDAGQLGKGTVELSYGKSISKDGRRTLKEITKGMKIVNSWALSIGSVCAQLDDARKSGLEIVSCTMDKDIMSFVSDACSKVEIVN